MKILFDTNIIIDFLLNREPFADEARELISLAGNSVLEGFIAANTVTDIFYIVRKKLSYIDTKNCLIDLTEIFKILPVTDHDCRKAIKSNHHDFEDALMMICAREAEMNYIVTRDSEFIDLCPEAISPASLLVMLK